MKKALLLLSVIVFTFSYSFANQLAGTKDSIKLTAIPRPFKLQENPKSFKVLSPNSISMTAGKETDLYTFVDSRFYTHNAPKFLFLADSNFIFTAKIKPNFKNEYDGGGLLIYSDSENWAKALFENNKGNKPGLGLSVVKDKKTDDSYGPLVSGGEVYVKIAKSGTVLCFYYSTNAKDWNLLRTFGFKSDKLHIGFYSQSPKGEECAVEYSSITYQAKAFTNFLTGE